jgi:hypothetical protein
LAIEPNYEQSKRNMQVLEQTRKNKGKVGLPIPPIPPPAAAAPPLPPPLLRHPDFHGGSK